MRKKTFELFPYGIWNRSWTWSTICTDLFELFPYGIWNYHHTEPTTEFLRVFELFPYGIWNIEKVSKMFQRFEDLNYFPMGFETSLILQMNQVEKMIWTISLWDLKPILFWDFHDMPYIWTISLWDLKLYMEVGRMLGLSYLNYFPMGFETDNTKNQTSNSTNIWTISLWDLKPTKYVLLFFGFLIWTISLWDLKLTE